MDCIYNIAEQRKCESSISRSEWKCNQVHLSSVNPTQPKPSAHSDCKTHKHKSSLKSVAVADFSCHDLFSWLVLHIAFSSLPFVIFSGSTSKHTENSVGGNKLLIYKPARFCRDFWWVAKSLLMTAQSLFKYNFDINWHVLTVLTAKEITTRNSVCKNHREI